VTRLSNSLSVGHVAASTYGRWASLSRSHQLQSCAGNRHCSRLPAGYARRYALFTLVGIAGEDDLDAPDTGPAQQDNEERAPVPVQAHGRTPANIRKPGNGFARKPSAPVLPPIESAAAGERLIGELGGVASQEQLTAWASRQMAIKNTLMVDDARAVEAAFQARLEHVIGSVVVAVTPFPAVGGQGATDADEPPAPVSVRSDAATLNSDRDVAGMHTGEIEEPDGGLGNGIDKSVLAIGELRRYRDKAHLKFVALRACLVCGRQPSDAHHLRFAQPRGLGRKVSDEFAVPLCRVHHREVHRSSDEPKWWKTYGLDPLTVASALWAQTRPLRPVAQPATPAQLIASPTSTPALLKTRRHRKTKPIEDVTP
jgi:hypothetical protein